MYSYGDNYYCLGTVLLYGWWHDLAGSFSLYKGYSVDIVNLR